MRGPIYLKYCNSTHHGKQRIVSRPLQHPAGVQLTHRGRISWEDSVSDDWNIWHIVQEAVKFSIWTFCDGMKTTYPWLKLLHVLCSALGQANRKRAALMTWLTYCIGTQCVYSIYLYIGSCLKTVTVNSKGAMNSKGQQDSLHKT